MLAEHNKQFC